MARKTSATKSSSRGKKSGASATSRKTLRKSEAPLAMKAEGDKGKKGGAGDSSPDGAKDDAKAGAKPSKADAKDAGGAQDDAKDSKSSGLFWGDAKADAKDAKDAKTDAKDAKSSGSARGDAKADTKKAAGSEFSDSQAKAPAAPPAGKDESAAAPASQEFEPPPPMEESDVAVLLPPSAIGNWDPQSPAPPPGKAPPGDSRSFRRFQDGVEEFVLIYRHEAYLITRAGKVGTQGTWTVVEYPDLGSAAHAYAQECSDFTAAGYRDLR